MLTYSTLSRRNSISHSRVVLRTEDQHKPKVLGAPTGWTLRVTDASLSAGAGFVVVIAGNTMLMPGLPKVSRATSIDVDDAGEIIGV